MKAKNLVGIRFGRLVVVERATNTKHGGARWRCYCDCGAETVVSSVNLRNSTGSCGCLKTEQNRAIFRKEAGHSGLTYLFGHYKRGAKKRRLLFTLSLEQFLVITQQPCTYCGAEPGQVAYNHQGTLKDPESIRHSSYIYNGVDRVNNDRGYEPDNVVSCCWACNRAKFDASPKQFLAWARRVATRHPVSSEVLGAFSAPR